MTFEGKPSEPDPGLARLLKQIEDGRPALQNAVATCALLRAAGERSLPRELLDVSPAQMADWLAATRRLCDQGDFATALPLCAHLCALDPTCSTHTFLWATCLQRTGHFAHALALWQSGFAARKTAASTYRAAECLQALGRVRAAWALCSESLEIARKAGSAASIRLATNLLDALRAERPAPATRSA